MQVYSYEGKNLEDLLSTSLEKLNASKEEVYYDTKEEISGIFKTKKYHINIVLKKDVIEFAKKYITDITKALGLNVEMEIQKRDNHIKINLFSDNNAILIGKNGQTIASLQTLLKQAVQAKTNTYVNFIIDANDYKEKQQRNLERLAKNLARDVERTKEPVKMDSMNSFERRIVHNALTNFKSVITTSEGEEPNRYVVIKPKED